MSLFGKSFEEKVEEALEAIRAKNIVEKLGAKIDGKIVTLTGMAKTMAAKTQAMVTFNEMVETENTLNQIHVEAPHVAATPSPGATAPMPTAAATGTPTMGPPAAATTERVHVVAKGDTLSHIAKSYYGHANDYMKIFNANKDILSDPDKIQIGQKLRIPN